MLTWTAYWLGDGIMNTDRSISMPVGIDRERDGAKSRPQFSEQEMRRLAFVVYRRQAGRMQPAPPGSADVDVLCAFLLAPAISPASRPASHQSQERTASTLPSWRSIRGGVPYIWAVYAEKYGTRRPGYVAWHRRGRE